MTQIRRPGSVEAAIHACIQTLSEARACEISGYGKTFLYDCSTGARRLSVDAMLRLDAEMKRVGMGTPITEACVTTLNAAPVEIDGADVVMSTLGIQAIGGKLAECVIDAAADGHFDRHETKTIVGILYGCAGLPALWKCDPKGG